jgi:hypothetical protein
MLMGRCNAVEKYLKDFVLLYFMTSQTPMVIAETRRTY